MIIKGTRHSTGVITIDGVPLTLPPLTADERRHSPTGLEWGYAGSGPAEAARAILLAACPEDEALARRPRCYQLFKDEVIARLSPDGFTLSGEGVRAWMHAFKTGSDGRALLEEMESLRELEDQIRVAEEQG